MGAAGGEETAAEAEVGREYQKVAQVDLGAEVEMVGEAKEAERRAGAVTVQVATEVAGAAGEEMAEVEVAGAVLAATVEAAAWVAGTVEEGRVVGMVEEVTAGAREVVGLAEGQVALAASEAEETVPGRR